MGRRDRWTGVIESINGALRNINVMALHQRRITLVLFRDYLFDLCLANK